MRTYTEMRRGPFVLIAMIGLIAVTLPANAQEEPDLETPPEELKRDATTPVDQLQVTLRPLTKEELEVELTGWLELLQSKIREVGDIACEHKLVLDEPPIMVHVDELADSSVNLFCRPWVKTKDYWTVRWDLTRQVKARFDAEGISITFPQRDVHTHSVQVPS